MFPSDFFFDNVLQPQYNCNLRSARNRSRLSSVKQRALRAIKAQRALVERDNVEKERKCFKELLQDFQNKLVGVSTDHNKPMASNSTSYIYRNDGKNAYTVTCRNVVDSKGNKKTYIKEKKNGQVLRKRQRHLLPGEKRGEVLTRFVEGVGGEEGFKEVWREAEIGGKGPFEVGERRKRIEEEGEKGEEVVEEKEETLSTPTMSHTKLNLDAMQGDSPHDDFIVVDEPAKLKAVEKVVSRKPETPAKTPSPPNSMPEGWMVSVDEE